MTDCKKEPQPPSSATLLSKSVGAEVEDVLDPILASIHGAAHRAENKHGLTVPCPTCGALRGARCLKRSGSVRAESHLGRRIVASGHGGQVSDK
jgi:hypothetical protein